MDETNIVFSLITASTAVVALVISVTQLIISNKQSLFDRRLKAYLTVRWMRSLCDENIEIYKSYKTDLNNGPVISIEYLFSLMTNTTNLEEIQDVISHVLVDNYHKKYVLKIEELRSLCEEIRLIFPEKFCYQMADFVYYYEEMLVSMYKYQILINRLSEECKKNIAPFPDDNKQEVNQRNKVLKFLCGTFEFAEKMDFTFFDKIKKNIKI